MEIEPVRRARAYEEVVRQLQDLMQRGLLRSGDRLPPERELANRFQVSRATVRQALSVLQAIGLIESRVGNGTFARSDRLYLTVTDLASALRSTRGTLAEQLELRRLIEPQVARLAAERGAEADLDAVSHYISLQEAHFSLGSTFIEEDSAFHLAIAHATKNTLLVKMIEGIHELLRESRERSSQTTEALRRSLEGHRRVQRAIRDRDGQAAYDAMLNHVLDVEGSILRLLAQDGPPEEKPSPSR